MDWTSGLNAMDVFLRLKYSVVPSPTNIKRAVADKKLICHSSVGESR